MFTFRTGYFILSLTLFITEVLIALYVNDIFVRPYLGDFLVVILIYCSARTVVKTSATRIAVGVLLFAYLVEFLQSMNVVAVLGLQHSTVAKTVLGTSFAWADMLAYTLGVLTIVILDRLALSRLRKNHTDIE